jgi:hypothetical protein
MNPASEEQQQYLDHAVRYVERATKCYDSELWSEAATNFGSALEALLRVRFGSGGTLFDLIDKFDKDPLFDDIIVHEGGSKRCATCSADEIRKLRNAVHPDCWKEATKKDVDRAGLLVFMLNHVLVDCAQSRIAVFRTQPNTTLSIMMAAGLQLEPVEPHEHNEP